MKRFAVVLAGALIPAFAMQAQPAKPACRNGGPDTCIGLAISRHLS